MSGHHDKTFASFLARLESGWRGLPDKPEETPRFTLERLWRWVAQEPVEATDLPPLTLDQRQHLEELLARRIAGEPLAYLTGQTRFMGLDLLCGPGAMIPRMETGILVRAALERLRTFRSDPEPPTVLDLCTGSGNVALAVAAAEPGCRVLGGDLSSEAVALARRNADRLHLSDRTSFHAGDLLGPFQGLGLEGTISLITCNPPYIPSASIERMPAEIQGHEPRAAFDGGPFGLSVLTRLVREATPFLRPGGWMICETGLGQGDFVANLFRKFPGFTRVETLPDPAGNPRAVAART